MDKSEDKALQKWLERAKMRDWTLDNCWKAAVEWARKDERERLLVKCTDRMPNPDEHDRVIIYTEGYDFNGEKYFDVRTETLNENMYEYPEDQPEVCRLASHWMPRPL